MWIWITFWVIVAILLLGPLLDIKDFFDKKTNINIAQKYFPLWRILYILFYIFLILSIFITRSYLNYEKGPENFFLYFFERIRNLIETSDTLSILIFIVLVTISLTLIQIKKMFEYRFKFVEQPSRGSLIFSYYSWVILASCIFYFFIYYVYDSPADECKLKYAQDDYQGTISKCSEAIDMGLSSAYFTRALAKNKLGDTIGSVEDYSQYLKYNPKSSNGYFNRAVLKIELGDTLGAMEDYNKALEIDPENSSGYFNRANLMEKLGDTLGAMEDYNKAIEINPEYSDAYNNRAILKKKLGDTLGAKEDYNKGFKFMPRKHN